MAEKKMQGAIEELFLDDNTFHGIKINPTLINYFYGKNGSGKSTIARLIRSKSGITPTSVTLRFWFTSGLYY